MGNCRQGDKLYLYFFVQANPWGWELGEERQRDSECSLAIQVETEKKEMAYFKLLVQIVKV